MAISALALAVLFPLRRAYIKEQICGPGARRELIKGRHEIMNQGIRMKHDDAATVAGEMSFQERYMAFLMSELPRLKTVALYPDKERRKLDKREVLLTALDLISPDGEGICLEFGVYKGKSLRAMARHFPQRRFYGFDSFEGFPEDGRADWQKSFAVSSLPEVPSNCTLVKGWFDETLEPFLQQHSAPVDFIDIDCDIYSSTSYVLQTLLRENRLRPGTIIYFDELLNYATHPWHEMLALFELLEAGGFGLRWICMHQRLLLVDDVLHMHATRTFPKWGDMQKKGYEAPAALQLTAEGIDYGPLHLPHYRKRVKAMARQFADLTGQFEAGQIRHDTTKPFYERARLFIKHNILRKGI